MSVNEAVLNMLDNLTLKQKINYIQLREESFTLAMEYLIYINDKKGDI